jgi:PRTRC genetic system ParB family protein
MTNTFPSTLPVCAIVQGRNPREYFDPDEFAKLKEGVRAANGVLQSILVRPIAGADLFEIVAGERRWRAAKAVLGEQYEMPVNVRELDDAEAEAMAVIENHHRANMSHAEEARAAQRQLIRYHGDKTETSLSMGWTPALLERRLALLTCSPAVLKALTCRKIQLGHAELLAGVPPEKQDSVLAAILERSVSVAMLKARLGQFARRLSEAVFDTTQCTTCHHNSAQQSGLFDESIGEGYCQHPTHYDELTLKTVEAKAQGLHDKFPVVRIIKQTDGFVPLRVAAEGALSVGPQQYNACRRCASFGCAVSAMPGSYGEITLYLCFDAACNSQKVSAWHKAQRQQQAPTQGTASTVIAGKPKPDSHTAGNPQRAAKPSNQTPQRLIEYRVVQWRRWAAKALMTNPERNQRVLIALVQSGHAGDVAVPEFGRAAQRIAGTEGERGSFGTLLKQAAGLNSGHLDRLVQAVAASAAFGIHVSDLEQLLNYLEVDEAHHFKLEREFLELFTMSELEALAEEIGLRKAMGAGVFKLAREKKKADFITSLLAVPGFAYQGTVPAVMRYPRQSVPIEPKAIGAEQKTQMTPDDMDEAAHNECGEALAA